MSVLHIAGLIEKKRDGGELTDDEIARLIESYTRDAVPDYQMSALAMAVFFRGLNPRETAALTRAMMESGGVMRHPPDSPPKVDKHSTGGIGDKVSLVLAPLLACDGLWVPMISGRGLGITGGTLDKLESIPGFNISLDEERTARQLARIGVVMIGQTEALCPADRKLYALRDVTGTVPSIGLITASIMSKKLAESLDRLVLDVKFGSGAFMKTWAQAAELAESLQRVGTAMGVDVQARLTPMDEPLGCTVGNALEVQEALDTLRGSGPPDLRQLTLDLAASVSRSPREVLESWLEDGTAYARFVEMVHSQDGDTSSLENYRKVHPAPIIEEFRAPHSGVLRRMDASCIGMACVHLGAGRMKTSDAIDPAVGCSELKKTGCTVEKGDVLFLIHARDRGTLESALPLFQKSVKIDS